MTRPRRVVFWVLALLATTPLWATEKWPDGYRLQTWTTDHGLPQNSVMAVARAADGYVWVGTQEGLVRFDGARFVPYDLVPQSGVRNGSVTEMLTDGNVVWVATANALYRGGNDGFVEILTEDERSLSRVSGLFSSDSGWLWIGGSDGIYRTNDHEARLHSLGIKWATTFAEHGDDFCSAGAQIYCWNGRDWEPRRPFPSGARDDAFSHIAFDRQGTLWAADASGDLWRSSGEQDLQQIELPERFAGVRVASMHVDTEGTLWLGLFRNGVVRVDIDGTISDWNPSETHGTFNLTSMDPEPDGTLWLGTIHAGLGRLHRPPFSVFSTPEGLREASVSCILEDRQGTVWIGTAGGGLHRLSGDRISVETGVESAHILSLAEDPDGWLWVGTAGDGVFRGESGRFRPVEGSFPIVLSMATDERGAMWIGALQSVQRHAQGSTEAIRPLTGLNATWIDAGDGAVWFSDAFGGVVRWRDDTALRFAENHGLPPTQAVAVKANPDGSVWVGTHLSGLIHFDGKRAVAVTTAEGLCADSVFSITEDDQGRFWMTSNHGVFVVERRQLEAVVAGERSTVECRLFGTADGLRNAECNGGQQPSAWRDRAGRLWFATVDGAAVVDPDDIASEPPPLVIEDVIVDGTRYDEPGGIVAPPGRGELEARFTSIDFDVAEALQFRYRLLGLDDEWITADRGDRRAYFTSLPPGDYRLQIQHRISGLAWAEPAAEVILHLRPAFVDTGWFMALVAAMITIVAWATNRGRVAILRHRQRQLEGIVADRTRELADINSTLEQRVEHGIAALRESERMAAYGHLIAGVAHEVRHPLFALRTAAHLLTAKLKGNDATTEELGILDRETDRMHQLVDDLLELGRPREMNLVSCDPSGVVDELLASASAHQDITLPLGADVEPDLPQVAADRGALHQVLLNLVHNASRHARGATGISLRIRRRENAVTFAVADDGEGIPVDVQDRIFEPFFSGGSGTGLGLAIARRLVTEQKGRLRVDSTLGQGSVFTVELPIA